ncbi:hypothetical protein SCA6_019005 [Theobroma cacao]
MLNRVFIVFRQVFIFNSLILIQLMFLFCLFDSRIDDGIDLKKLCYKLYDSAYLHYNRLYTAQLEEAAEAYHIAVIKFRGTSAVTNFDISRSGSSSSSSFIKLGNYSSMEGVLYCKPHFEQLFKETGNFNKNFQSPAAESAEKLTPELVNLLCNTKCV